MSRARTPRLRLIVCTLVASLGGIAADHTNESQVVELADGRLMLNMRNHPPQKPENLRRAA